MGVRRFRSRVNLELWAANFVERIGRAGGDRMRLVGELVATLWRDGYRCGYHDRCAEVASALGLDQELGEPAVEPWEGAERLQRRRR